MGYTIEISINVRKPNTLIKSNKERFEIAENNLCEMQYFMHEIEGKKNKITKSESIHVVYFSDYKFKNLLNFIKTIRLNRYFYIDCIYRDDIKSNFLFVSPKYLHKMDKPTSKKIQREIKKEIFDEEKVEIKKILHP